MIGTTELLLLGALALLIFGGKKVPELMRGLGQGIKEFKKGMEEPLQTNKPSNENKDKDNSLEESK